MSTVEHSGPTVPEVVRRKAHVLGAAQWLDELPGLIRRLTYDWDIELGSTFEGATEAYAAEVMLSSGEPAVLKIPVRANPAALNNELTVLRLAGGNGCVRLLKADPERGAMLLERLGPSLYDLGLPIEQRHAILCDLAARMWRPAPECGLPAGDEKAHALAATIPKQWEQLDRPCSEATIDHAIRCAESRAAAHDDERARLVHGDLQQWNALRSADGAQRSADGFALVDPDGLLAEPELDLGVIMREDPVELIQGDPHDRSRWLATRTGLDETAIWEWGVVERVSTGLLARSIGLQPVGDQMLHAADQIATQ